LTLSSSVVKRVFDHPENTDSNLLLVSNKLPVNMAPHVTRSVSINSAVKISNCAFVCS